MQKEILYRAATLSRQHFSCWDTMVGVYVHDQNEFNYFASQRFIRQIFIIMRSYNVNTLGIKKLRRIVILLLMSAWSTVARAECLDVRNVDGIELS
jgi:hypothetical protein